MLEPAGGSPPRPRPQLISIHIHQLFKINSKYLYLENIVNTYSKLFRNIFVIVIYIHQLLV